MFGPTIDRALNSLYQSTWGRFWRWVTVARRSWIAHTVICIVASAALCAVLGVAWGLGAAAAGYALGAFLGACGFTYKEFKSDAEKHAGHWREAQPGSEGVTYEADQIGDWIGPVAHGVGATVTYILGVIA